MKIYKENRENTLKNTRLKTPNKITLNKKGC